jgi:hypothetical protein
MARELLPPLLHQALAALGDDEPALRLAVAVTRHGSSRLLEALHFREVEVGPWASELPRSRVIRAH